MENVERGYFVCVCEWDSFIARRLQRKKNSRSETENEGKNKIKE